MPKWLSGFPCHYKMKEGWLFSPLRLNQMNGKMSGKLLFVCLFVFYLNEREVSINGKDLECPLCFKRGTEKAAKTWLAVCGLLMNKWLIIYLCQIFHIYFSYILFTEPVSLFYSPLLPCCCMNILKSYKFIFHWKCVALLRNTVNISLA